MFGKKTSSDQKKLPWWKIAIVVGSVISFVIIGLVIYFNTKSGKEWAVDRVTDAIYDKLEKDETIRSQETPLKDADRSQEAMQNQKEGIYNIALLGIQDGNSDTMIIATLDTIHKSLKLTSLMRDIYVEIPGHDPQKLNAAYQFGRADLFYQTFEKNFQIPLDGYIAADYDAFEAIVDEIKGVEITLTKKEASYLNGTNYISEKKYRTVVEGTQTLNGNQALGYCRIRKVATADNEHFDFGRTSRQRKVLDAIYKKLKDKNVVELAMIMNDILSNTSIKTDIARDDFRMYMNQLIALRNQTIVMDRVPWDDTYDNDKRKIGSHNSSVLVIRNWDETRAKLRQSLTGESK